jgi:hypothetical protein
MINAAFIQQSASDVHRKLQRMEGFAGANIDQLISIVAKVVANRGAGQKRERKISGKKSKDPGYGPQGGRWEDQRPEGRPQQERTEKLSGKKTVHLL